MNNLEIGLKHLAENNIEKAEYHLNQAITEDSNNIDIAAINDFEKVLELNSERKDAAVAIEMMQNIISFRNPDLMNH
jgi:hypothetical protein